MKYLFPLVLLLLCYKAQAQPKELSISPLERVDEIFLNHKRESLKDLTFSKLNKIIRGDKRDISTLQDLLDQEVVQSAQDQELFAMGVALGDIYVKEYPQLSWKLYDDEYGKSRAVCLERSEYCLFPITMISKRVKRGFAVDINEVYERGIDLIDDYFPKLPYAVEKKQNKK